VIPAILKSLSVSQIPAAHKVGNDPGATFSPPAIRDRALADTAEQVAKPGIEPLHGLFDPGRCPQRISQTWHCQNQKDQQ